MFVHFTTLLTMYGFIPSIFKSSMEIFWSAKASLIEYVDILCRNANSKSTKFDTVFSLVFVNSTEFIKTPKFLFVEVKWNTFAVGFWTNEFIFIRRRMAPLYMVQHISHTYRANKCIHIDSSQLQPQLFTPKLDICPSSLFFHQAVFAQVCIPKFHEIKSQIIR